MDLGPSDKTVRPITEHSNLPFSKRIKIEPADDFESGSISYTDETILGGLGCTDQPESPKSKRKQSTDSESCLLGTTGDLDLDLTHRDSERRIKEEVDDADERYSINTELTIKNEPADEILPTQTENDNKIESTEAFLSRSPEVFTKFCGLPDIDMFNALFEYIEFDMREVKGATKFEQLFGVLAKLHRNEDNLYLNKYLFPATYVYIVQLLYKKLGLLCRKVGDIGIPNLFMPHFDSSQKIVIIGIHYVSIKMSPDVSNAPIYVQYLVGYTAYGDVCFVSKRHPRDVSIKKLLHCSGLLDTLRKECWILFNHGEDLFVTQVENLKVGKPLCKELYTKTVRNYILQVVNRLPGHFEVLQNSFSDYMLFSDDRKVCFLDEIVFVCGMLLNLLRRCAY